MSNNLFKIIVNSKNLENQINGARYLRLLELNPKARSIDNRSNAENDGLINWILIFQIYHGHVNQKSNC